MAHADIGANPKRRDSKNMPRGQGKTKNGPSSKKDPRNIEPDEGPQRNSYNAEMVAGALLERESRVIARLLLDEVDDKTWNDRLIRENILQKRTQKTIQRQAGLIRKRLEPLGKDGWKLVDRGSSEIVRHLLLAACIKHNRLIGDFLQKVVQEHTRLFEKKLSPRAWATFLEEVGHRVPVVSTWSDSTKEKLGQVTHKILVEAGILDGTRTKKILPFFLPPEVASYLRKHEESYILKCLELS